MGSSSRAIIIARSQVPARPRALGVAVDAFGVLWTAWASRAWPLWRLDATSWSEEGRVPIRSRSFLAWSTLPYDEWRTAMAGFLQRRQQSLASSPPSPSPEDDRLRQAMPALISHLVDAEYDDGSARLTSSLTVFSDQGVLKAALNDKDTGETLWVSAPGLHTLLATLERHLRDGTGDWRMRAGQPPRRTKGGRRN